MVTKKKSRNMKFLKASTALALTASVAAVSSPQTTEASNLKDLDPKAYYYQDVIALAERGIIKGYPDGTYKPGKAINRGEAANILAGILNLDTTNVVDPNFPDVAKNAYYYGAVAALKTAGVITGNSDGTYTPDDEIERYEMAIMLQRAFKLTATKDTTVPFKDVNNSFYKEAVTVLFEHGITTGKTNTVFDGTADVSRGEMATFIVRAEKAAAKVAEQEAKEKEITFVLSDYTNKEVNVNGKTYKLSEAVSTIFTNNNKAALAQAEIVAIVKNGVMESIKEITLNAAGTEEKALVFDTKATVAKLEVNANYVVVKNIQVTGDLVVSSSVNTKIELNGVNVQGDIVLEESPVVAVASLNAMVANKVQNGPKITIVGGQTHSMIVNRNNASIESDVAIKQITISATVDVVNIDGTVTKVVIESTKALELTGDATITEMILETAAKLNLNLTGVIEKLLVNNADAKVTLATTIRVTTAVIPTGSTSSNIFGNTSQIGNVTVGNNPSGGGSTGGGSTGGTPGGTPGGSDTVATVSSVAVKTAPTKTEYIAGEQLDLSGLVVTLTKSDSTTEDVAFVNFESKGITTSKANGATLTTADSGDIVITVNGKTVTQAITVTEKQTPPTWEGLNVQKIESASLVSGSPEAAKANQEAVTVAGDLENGYTVTATKALQSYKSSNSAQGEGKWVGFIVDTGLESILGLSVDTGSGTYYTFTTADVAEAASVGAEAGQFVFWMKVDGKTERTLKIKNGEEVKAVKITVADYQAPPTTPDTARFNLEINDSELILTFTSLGSIDLGTTTIDSITLTTSDAATVATSDTVEVTTTPDTIKVTFGENISVESFSKIEISIKLAGKAKVLVFSRKENGDVWELETP